MNEQDLISIIDCINEADCNELKFTSFVKRLLSMALKPFLSTYYVPYAYKLLSLFIM